MDDPFQDVRNFLSSRGARLVRWNGDFYTYTRGIYRVLEEEALRSEVYRLTLAKTKSKVDRFIDALKAYVHCDRDRTAPPSFLEPVGLDSENLIVVENGVLDLSTSKLWKHDSRLFSLTALPFAYYPNVEAKRWLQFLNEIWPNEPDCITALQLVFGYLISSRTDLQIIPVLTGPPRSGKGTIGRILMTLIGAGNWAAPTLDSLGTNFGLQPFIGKRLIIFSDARVGKRTNKTAVTETLLRVSGEDPVSVARKFKEDWEGQLRSVIVMMGNEPPTFHDSSSALMARYRVLAMHQSFVGREDRGLDNALRAELPGILNWAIEGWRRLNEVGEIAQPASSADIVQSIERLSNVVKAYIDDTCILDPSGCIEKSEVYDRFKRWCDENGVRSGLSREWFGRELMSTYGHRGVEASKGSIGSGRRVPVYKGLRLRLPSDS